MRGEREGHQRRKDCQGEEKKKKKKTRGRDRELPQQVNTAMMERKGGEEIVNLL